MKYRVILSHVTLHIYKGSWQFWFWSFQAECWAIFYFESHGFPCIRDSRQNVVKLEKQLIVVSFYFGERIYGLFYFVCLARDPKFDTDIFHYARFRE